jgi:amino acid transporter
LVSIIKYFIGLRFSTSPISAISVAVILTSTLGLVIFFTLTALTTLLVVADDRLISRKKLSRLNPNHHFKKTE